MSEGRGINPRDVCNPSIFIPPDHPHGYPLPCLDNPALLRCFPGPWLRTCDFAFNSPGAKTVTNISLIDAFTHIIDDGDQTKRFKFQVDQVTTGTTREITIPDEDFTLITQTSADTLTNKTIVGSTNSIGATQFETTGIPVVITSSAPTAPGQALVTTSLGTATWQTVSGGGGSNGNIAYSLNNGKVSVINLAYKNIGTFTWLQSRYGSYTGGVVLFHVTVVDRTLDIRLRNITTGSTLGTLTGINTSGVKNFIITLPAVDSEIEIQVLKDSIGGTSPIVTGITLEFIE